MVLNMSNSVDKIDTLDDCVDVPYTWTRRRSKIRKAVRNTKFEDDQMRDVMTEAEVIDWCAKVYSEPGEPPDPFFMEQHEWVTNSGSEAVVIQRGQTVVVVCRGTEVSSFVDIAIDLRARPIAVAEGGGVHAGFRLAAERLKTRLFDAVRKLSPKTVVFAGHSLGGGMATTLASDWLADDKNSEVWLITAGCPRVFTKAASVRLETRLMDRGGILRFVRGADLVPRIPPPGLIVGYRHVGPSIMIRDNGDTIANPTITEIILQRIMAWMKNRKSMLLDHASEGYAKAVAEHVARRRKSGQPVLFER